MTSGSSPSSRHFSLSRLKQKQKGKAITHLVHRESGLCTKNFIKQLRSQIKSGRRLWGSQNSRQWFLGRYSIKKGYVDDWYMAPNAVKWRKSSFIFSPHISHFGRNFRKSIPRRSPKGTTVNQGFNPPLVKSPSSPITAKAPPLSKCLVNGRYVPPVTLIAFLY